MYFNRHVAESLDLKAGEEIQISVPDKEHIVLKRMAKNYPLPSTAGLIRFS